jgi:hypothetical protein
MFFEAVELLECLVVQTSYDTIELLGFLFSQLGEKLAGLHLIAPGQFPGTLRVYFNVLHPEYSYTLFF